LGFFALATFANFEFNGLALFEVLKPVALDVREVDEYVVTVFS